MGSLPLRGKVAFITGAARGQGRSHAVRLARNGADVIAFDICGSVTTAPYAMASDMDLATTATQVTALGRRIVTARIDVRDRGGLRDQLDAAVGELGGLDIVVANAGFASFCPADSMSDDIWDDMIDVNLTGVFNTVRASIPHLRAGGLGGAIVLTGSTASVKGNANLVHYTAAKHGVLGLMKALAIELGPDRIRVNAVLPTTTDTAMVHNSALYQLFLPDHQAPTRDDVAAVLPALHALPEPWVDPEDISAAVEYLVSDTGRFVTGVALPVDAGWLVR
ncbi:MULTISPECIES: mycofactocin-coupled SDR family oxidoreductase [Rhodococcus]|uniref:mycofactocin-coupled SDR family oxidoreductase n=1 Tax=Rhodococcus TaxID=1827 RepID=UPI00228573A9|nr:mycofactocin-coupled SDR family oxidoreductase [Rhodococcus sp. JS3073]WAM16915.1 mycofactocin-coupled SDR family oxidoreductase [Rhodococcus sp. JS3073]